MKLGHSLFNFSWIVVLSLLGGMFSTPYWSVPFILVFFLLFFIFKQPNKAAEIRVERLIKGTNFQEGDPIHIVYEIYNTSSDITFYGEIYVELPPNGMVWEGTNLHVLKIPPNQSRTIKFQLIFRRRGKYLIGPLHVRHHNFGFFMEKHETIELYKEFIIVPQADKISVYPFKPRFLVALGGLFKSKLVGDGIEFAGVREYRPGDSFRRINWKTSAKYGELHSNEFQLNRSTNLIIVLDLTEESNEIADISVRAALGLAEYLINSRTKVGVLTIGKYIQFLPAKTGKRHLLGIVQHLTTVHTLNEISEITLFKQRLSKTVERIKGRNNEVILFSSLHRYETTSVLVDILPQIGSLTILAPSGMLFRGRRTKEVDMTFKILELRKRILQHTLATKDIRIFEWVPDLPFDVSLSKWRFHA